MKNNKKFMAVVAGAAIVSQLLPMGTVIANAQTRTCINFPDGNQTKPHNNYGNDIEIFSQNGTDGFRIMFDVIHNKLHVKPLDEKMSKEKLSNTDKSRDYLIIKLTNEKKELIKTFTFKGDSTIGDVVKELDGTTININYGIRINYNYENKSRVKISGEVENASRCYEVGIEKKYLAITTFMIGQKGLVRQEDSTK